MKKVGIVSRIHGVNYGANLQAVALQTALKNIGVESEYINYEVKIPSANLFRGILTWGFGVVRNFLGYRRRVENTKKFRERYLVLSPSIKTKKELSEYSRNYSTLMAGSDQIWNPRYYPLSNGLYLLSFNDNIRKVSYASSFGIKHFPDDFKKIYKEELSKFDSLSVREQEGIEILKEIGLNDVIQSIDPTLLFDSKHWENYFDHKPIVKEDYICCYVMTGADDLNKFIISKARELQKQLSGNEQIIILGEKEYKGIGAKEIYVRTAGPAEFLNYIFNAKYVLTSSFHGTCFSLIFNKQFFSILSCKNKFNSRIENLLKKVHQERRIIYMENNHDFELLEVDYSTVNKILEQERLLSMDYLKQLSL